MDKTRQYHPRCQWKPPPQHRVEQTAPGASSQVFRGVWAHQECSNLQGSLSVRFAALVESCEALFLVPKEKTLLPPYHLRSVTRQERDEHTSLVNKNSKKIEQSKKQKNKQKTSHFSKKLVGSVESVLTFQRACHLPLRSTLRQ